MVLAPSSIWVRCPSIYQRQLCFSSRKKSHSGSREGLIGLGLMVSIDDISIDLAFQAMRLTT